MTLEKLAKLANVSVSTVSKAFSGSRDISEETRRKVFQIAKEQGCYEKYYKGCYARRVIAVICPEIQSEYYGAMVTLLEQKLDALGADMVLSLSNFHPERERELFEYHSYFQKADGVILIGAARGISNRNRIPCVALTSIQKERWEIDRVGITLQEALNTAVAHLRELGHRDICFLSEKLTDAKEAMFLAALDSNGLPARPEQIVTSEKRFENAGYDAMEELFRRRELPTAVVAAYDYMALGALYSIRSHGLKVPQDISVVGMDDISVSSFLDVGLTSIQTHVEEMCTIALELLWKKINNPYFTVRQTVAVAGDLVIRQSTGPAPGIPRQGGPAAFGQAAAKG